MYLSDIRETTLIHRLSYYEISLLAEPFVSTEMCPGDIPSFLHYVEYALKGL